MKIAQVITRLDWAGAPSVVRMICERMASETTLISGPSPNMTAATRRFLEEYDGPVIRVTHLRRNVNPVCDVIALLDLFLIFRRERFDVVHTHTSKAGFLGRIAAHLAGVPAIVHMPHGSPFRGYGGRLKSRLFVALERTAARVTGRLLALTEAEKAEYAEAGAAPAGGTEVLDPGIEIDRIESAAAESRARARKELGLPAEGSLVGMVCRLEEVKAPEHFIEAAGAVAAGMDNVRFLVAGDGPRRPLMEGMVEKSTLKGRIDFLGWREDAPRVVSALDVLVLPSLNEGAPMVLLEAQALGVPVVATKVGGTPGIVKDGETGLLVPPGEPAAIADAVRALLGDGAKRKAFAEEGRRWVRERFSSEAMLKRLREIYEEMAPDE
jgi:glycosyltransferase involved in cell wall biosynthesis